MSFNCTVRFDHTTNAFVTSNENSPIPKEIRDFVSEKVEEAQVTRARELANGLQGLKVHYDDLVLLATLLVLDQDGQQAELASRQIECPKFIENILTFLNGVKIEERQPLVGEFQKVLNDRLR